MKVYKSELFGKIPKPSKFEDVIKLSIDPTPDETRAVRMWRGQADINWPIHSTGYRRVKASPWTFTTTEKHLQSYERGLIKRADHKGFRNHEGEFLSDMELLAKLRHHGAATRLVDATRNMLVALWFCVSEKPKEFGLLIGIHAHFIGGYEGEKNDKTYDECMDVLQDYDYPITWEPSGVSARVAAQRSQFLYSAVCESKTGSLFLPKDDGATLAIAISPEMKALCKKILIESFDIRQVTLFPDLDGFCIANNVFSTDTHRW